MSSNSKLTTYTPNGIRVVIGDGSNSKHVKAMSKSLKRLNEEAEAIRRLELEAAQKAQNPYAGHEEVE